MYGFIQFVFFTLYCFVIQFMMFLCFFCSPSKFKLVGLPWFANVCQVACIHIRNDAGLQWQAAQKPRGPKCSIIMRSVGNRIIKSLKRAKRLRFIQTFIRTFTTWVTLEFSIVKRREKSVYISTGMYKYLHKYLHKLYQREPQIATNETSKLQTLHCSPSKAGATNLCEFVAFGHQLCFFKDLSRSEFGPTLYCQNLLNATRSDAMMAGQHSWQHIR